MLEAVCNPIFIRLYIIIIIILFYFSGANFGSFFSNKKIWEIMKKNSFRSVISTNFSIFWGAKFAKILML
jgi:ABC-type xylose transport system permease subunit